jgi:predicted transcriptional regulator
VKDPAPTTVARTQALGPLEVRVMEEIWARGVARVRDLAESFPGVAYTTLMTTADRLFRKGLLVRERDGRAFRYRPRWTRDEFHLKLASSAMATFLPGGERNLMPLISLFVDEVSRRDHAMLDELERLVQRKKAGRS